jgi:hypothetical protein
MPPINRQITLAARPSGMPKESDFALVEAPMPTPAEGEALVKILWLSVDPYMRPRMARTGSYAEPVKIGGVMVGGAVGQVIESRSPALARGDYVEGMLGWQEYAAAPAQQLRKLDPALAPVSTALGVLGMPGMTAYFGLLEICDPKPCETVVVSGAAGAVGSLVGQIAKIKGARVVGIAGSDEKVSWLVDELGFDGAFNYKTAKSYYRKLVELCPKGVDVYFDNVGGPITDAVIRLINDGARISVCGQISQYNSDKIEMGPRWLGQVLIKQAKVEGFLVFKWADRYPEAMAQMAQWIKEGKLKYREQFTEGLESAPRAFIGMLQGENIGKQLVRVS